MTVLLLVLVSIVVLVLGGRFYSRFLARSIGEDPTRKTPATTKNDGADYSGFSKLNFPVLKSYAKISA